MRSALLISQSSGERARLAAETLVPAFARPWGLRSCAADGRVCSSVMKSGSHPDRLPPTMRCASATTARPARPSMVLPRRGKVRFTADQRPSGTTILSAHGAAGLKAHRDRDSCTPRCARPGGGRHRSTEKSEVLGRSMRSVAIAGRNRSIDHLPFVSAGSQTRRLVPGYQRGGAGIWVHCRICAARQPGSLPSLARWYEADLPGLPLRKIHPLGLTYRSSNSSSSYV